MYIYISCLLIFLKLKNLESKIKIYRYCTYTVAENSLFNNHIYIYNFVVPCCKRPSSLYSKLLYMRHFIPWSIEFHFICSYTFSRWSFLHKIHYQDYRLYYVMYDFNSYIDINGDDNSNIGGLLSEIVYHIVFDDYQT